MCVIIIKVKQEILGSLLNVNCSEYIPGKIEIININIKMELFYIQFTVVQR